MTQQTKKLIITYLESSELITGVMLLTTFSVCQKYTAPPKPVDNVELNLRSRVKPSFSKLARLSVSHCHSCLLSQFYHHLMSDRTLQHRPFCRPCRQLNENNGATASLFIRRLSENIIPNNIKEDTDWAQGRPLSSQTLLPAAVARLVRIQVAIE